jgi:beta-lactam-binding protein with PASTA domain/Ca2+-binding RTX toxin-like protein
MSLRTLGKNKRWPFVMVVAMFLSGISPSFMPQSQVSAQVAAGGSPVGQGFSITADDYRFIYEQILVAQDHAAGGVLLGQGPNQVHDPQLPRGLRTVDGSFNNLVPVPDQHMFGAADRLFPRLLTPNFRDAEPAPGTTTPRTSYKQNTGTVFDSEPRMISNLIVDQTTTKPVPTGITPLGPGNPAAQAAHDNPCGSGGFVCGDPSAFESGDPTGSLFIPNITPDFGLSAPFNLMFTFFGQFFDHGLDLVPKAGGSVVIPLKTDDPLFIKGSPTNFMVMTRGLLQPGGDGILGTADDVKDSVNQTTPWVDQNQTYTSHPSHQVFLRQYVLDANGRPVPDGKVLDGDHCAPRGTGFANDDICNIGNWGKVKQQAAQKLGIQLLDTDVLDVPLILTDPYGHFKPGPARGMPQLVLPPLTPGGPNRLVEGNPADNGGKGTLVDGAFRTGHAFLNDIAHNAVPVDANGNALPADTPLQDAAQGPGGICDFRQTPSCQPPGTYDDELLAAHFVTGDGRGNENIALSMVHQLFHAEHNRIASEFDHNINLPVLANGRNAFGLTQAEINGWKGLHGPSGWGYGERLFQAARFGTEMQYQHLVFEEFARKVQPLINAFLGGLTSFDPAITAEFAHTVYRLGHSMLPEVLHRENLDGTTSDIRLFNAFLNPESYNGPGGTLTAAQAAGTLINGLSKQVANELDEFTTSSVRNTLVGLPLDLPAINIARGRSEGIPGLNMARKELFAKTKNSALQPYATWFEFGQGLRHHESLVNFIAAYATHPTVTSVTEATACPATGCAPGQLVTAKRAAAQSLMANNLFMFADTPAKAATAGCSDATCGLDNVDFWVGGLAERQAAFGGLLGSTFNYVFESQLEHLQDFDRFYYLQRTDGLNFRFSLEGNSLAELARRNTVSGGTMDNIFDTADFNFNAAALTGTAPIDLGDGIQLLTEPDGTKLFFDPLHTGKNIVFNGDTADNRFKADIGDDTLYGNGGNDRIEGNDGNDTLLGGDGDDILFGGNGDDILKGGPGNDALSSGPGFGGDLEIGGEGNDFLLGGDDGVEYFGGPGDDVFIDGSMRAEGIFGGEGDDWIFDGEGHDGGMFGDGGNVFDLLAGLSAVGGNDVLGGGPGQDNHFGEGGDDIMLMSEGSNKFFGDYGFDWITLRGWNAPEFIELGLLALPNVPLNFNDLRNKYRFVDGASGWDLDDHIAGSDTVLCTPPGEIAECFVVGMELTVGTAPQQVPAIGVPGQFNFRNGSGAANIAGLTELMGPAGFNKSLTDPAVPGVKGVGFMGGDILLGGKGSDILEGKMGNDLIDGDVWLNVQLRAVMNDGTIKLVDDPRDLVADVFSDPQRLNPGNISIIRSIVTPPSVPADCGAVQPRNCDTAVFAFDRAEYDIVVNANGTVDVIHVPSRAAVVRLDQGTDTLRNIERLQFADVTIPTPTQRNTVPGVIGLTLAQATTAILNAGLRVGTVTQANSTTIGIGKVMAVDPREGTTLPANTRVDLVISLGTITPVIVGAPSGDSGTRGTAENIILEAGMVVGTVTQAPSTTVPVGIVISQNPVDGLTVDVGTAMNFVVSSGRPPVAVPNVVGQTQAAATTSLTNAGFTVTVTTAASTSVQAGTVISQTPTGGSTAPAGSAVAIVVSLGTAPTISTTVSRSQGPNLTIASPAFAVQANTLLVAFVSTDAPPTGGNTAVNSINNSGTGLTWTRAARAAVQRGDAEVWWAFAAAPRASMTATAVLNSSQPASITVVGFTGAANTMVGAATIATNKATGIAGEPTATITTTRANSWVFGVGVDWDLGRTLTAQPGSTIVNQVISTSLDTYWVVRSTNPQVLAPVPVTIGVSGVGTDRWNFAVVEIRQP